MKKNEIMSKTKIVCTIGPASESKEMLTKLVKAGMNVMRLNFSHGDHASHKEKIELIHDYAVRSHRIFGQFIYGKFLDSLIIGIIAFIGLAILKVKFFPILAVFILITNMIPYFGPFIGGFPAVLVALMTGDLFHALAVLVFVFALQQFDGLFLGPKILGDVVGISPFWVLLSITVFGHFFGFIGMFLGVPMICVIRMLFNDIIDFHNKMKELDT